MKAETITKVVCSGRAFELGLCQGQSAAKQILAARRVLSELEAFRLKQPIWLPYTIYRWVAERKSLRYLQAALSSNHSQMLDRLRGIANGADLSLQAMCLFNALEPLLSSVGDCTVSPGACSAISVRGRRSANGCPIVARNFDYLKLVQPFYMIRDVRPESGFRSLEFTTAPLAGAVDGINEAGLCITYDYAFTTDRPASFAPPISVIIAETLQCCSTVTEAEAYFRSKSRWGGGILMVADPSGDIASFELSNTQLQVRRPAQGEDVLHHTNLFSTPEMQSVQIPLNAIYGHNAPTHLRGRRLHESSIVRDQRFQQLLSEHDIIGTDELGEIMSDHGPENQPGGSTLCVHGNYWHTTACLQFFPSERKMRVAFSTACEATFTDFQL
ncbi:MAG: hypothetical protein JNL58_05760 [Planctomyces sp.]|nr:hypothetical protein [Planctomyces sp.]